MKPFRTPAAPSCALPPDPRNHDGARPTLADLSAWLEANPSRERRHVEMKSAVRRMGVVLRRPLTEIPAEPAQLRALIAVASRVSVGMTKARWSRVRSLTLAALRDAGIDVMPGRDIGSLSPAWKTITSQLPTQATRLGLSRFLSFCTRQGIEPADVTAQAFEDFHAALHTRSLKAKPEALYRQTIRLWNKAVAAVDALPRLVIPLARHERYYSLDWTAFPASFAADVEAFLANSANGRELDVFDDDYVRPVKPSTVALRRRQLRQIATLLVASGFPIAELTSLAVLVRPENAVQFLNHQVGRQGGRMTVSLGLQAWLLCVIARHWVREPAHLEKLRKYARKASDRPKDMTPRNRERLRQLELRANLDALLLLPFTVLRRAEGEKTGNIAGARDVMLALAVEFLLVAPMRIGNLTGIEHGRHLLEIGRGRERNVHILIPGEETKTGAAFEVLLPDDSAALLDVYLEKYRPRLCQGPSPFLFPNGAGGRRGTISFSRSVSGFIEKETGIRMHVHLFRHLAGKLHLDANPEDIETVRRVLGHTSSETTIRHYVGQRYDQALARYGRTLAGLRDNSDPLTFVRRPRKSRPSKYLGARSAPPKTSKPTKSENDEDAES